MGGGSGRPERRIHRQSAHGQGGAAGQQHAQFLEAFADGGDGLREVQVALRGPAGGLAVRLRVLCAGGEDMTGASVLTGCLA